MTARHERFSGGDLAVERRGSSGDCFDIRSSFLRYSSLHSNNETMVTHQPIRATSS